MITGKQIAPHTINSKHLVNHTIQKHDLSTTLVNSLHGARGPMGPQGPVGPQGPTGPQGPKGSDSTVHYVGGSMDLGGTVSTDVISAKGPIGKLKLDCNWDNGGKGTITYTMTEQAGRSTRLIFSSPDFDPSVRSWFLHIWRYEWYPEATVQWSGTAHNDIWFDMLLNYSDADSGGSNTGLALLHGYVAVHAPAPNVHGYCDYLLYSDDIEITKPSS